MSLNLTETVVSNLVLPAILSTYVDPFLCTLYSAFASDVGVGSVGTCNVGQTRTYYDD